MVYSCIYHFYCTYSIICHQIFILQNTWKRKSDNRKPVRFYTLEYLNICVIHIIIQMLWLTYAIASIFLMGAFNVFLQATKDTIPKEFHYTHIYLCCILVLAGILGGISLICYQVLYPNALSELCNDCFTPYYMIVTIPAMLQYSLAHCYLETRLIIELF